MSPADRPASRRPTSGGPARPGGPRKGSAGSRSTGGSDGVGGSGGAGGRSKPSSGSPSGSRRPSSGSPGRGGASGGSSDGTRRPSASGDRRVSPAGSTGSRRPESRGGSGGRPQGPGERPARSSGGSSGSRGRPERPEPEVAGPKKWGSLGRRGAGRLGENKIDTRNAIGAIGRDERPDPGHEMIHWERVDDGRAEAKGAVARSRSGKPQGRDRAKGRADERPKGRAEEVRASSERRGRAPRPAGAGTGGAVAKDELARALGGPRGARANERLRDAAHAFERERYEEARSLLRPVAVSAPQATSVRELLGLTYYRLGKWSDAVRELEAFREQSGTAEQHPVLADSYRALKRHTEVETLWEELREASPSGALVTEGRIVMAGSLADRRKMGEAIGLLERSHRSVKRAQTHHLRQAYALADLYERAGDVSRARELFRWITGIDAEFADAAERASALA